MTATTTSGRDRSYACNCLNVRIHSRPPPDDIKPPWPAEDKEYTPIYVGDEGISVGHAELTLRSRSRAKERKQGDDTLLTRYMSLTCLVCQTLVYRVLQTITPDIDSGEGPIPPTDEWAECELLKTSSGWIELYKDTISGDDIAKIETSPRYSQVFHIALPSDGPPPSSTAPPYSELTKTDPEQQKYLPPLPPLFLPPPFTPSHLVFRHVAEIASEVSSKLREEAEAYLAQVVQDKVRELQEAETRLRQEVETIWLSWKAALGRVEQETLEKKLQTQKRRTVQFTVPTSPTGAGAGNGMPASVRINNFVLPQSPPRRQAVAASLPARGMASALSASLATSAFQHPRAQAERTGATPTPTISNGRRSSPEPDSPTTQRARSPGTASSRTLAMNVGPDPISIRDATRRNMDESKDIATSFKYVLDLAEDGSRGGPAALLDETSLIPRNTVPSISSLPPERSPKPATKGKTALKKPSPGGAPSASVPNGIRVKEGARREKEKQESGKGKGKNGEDKGKRKVTFDVHPDVITEEGESLRETRTGGSPSGEAAVFDFESEVGDRGDTVDPLPTRPAEPAVPAETIQLPRRPSHKRPVNTTGLPSSLSTLRPASLPLPSMMRRVSREDRSPERKLFVTPVEPRAESEKTPQALEEEAISQATEDEEQEFDSREAEILRLVAAHTPSHRNAWRKNGNAWQVFVSRQERKNNYKKRKGVDRIAEEEEEEGESGSSRAGYYDESEDVSTEEEERKQDPHVQLATSAPIPIAPIVQGRPFVLTSYQPKTSLSDRPGTLVPAYRRHHHGKIPSSAAARRASYAERDRARSIDPGVVDFAALEDEDEEEEEDDLDLGEDLNGLGLEGAEGGDGVVEGKGGKRLAWGKARSRTLKILQARNSVPAAGMWRSLV